MDRFLQLNESSTACQCPEKRVAGIAFAVDVKSGFLVSTQGRGVFFEHGDFGDLLSRNNAIEAGYNTVDDSRRDALPPRTRFDVERLHLERPCSALGGCIGNSLDRSFRVDPFLKTQQITKHGSYFEPAGNTICSLDP